MAATIKMVAQRAGVSVATVSKYINGGNVLDDNRIRVQQAIDELDYKINEVARSLKTNKTYTVGVLASNIQSTFITSIISAIQNTLFQHGYTTIIADYQEDKEIEKKQLNVLLMRQVDGIIIFPEDDEEEIVETVKKSNIPLVIINNMLENCKCDAVLTDNINGAYAAIEKLILNKHKKIAVLTGNLAMSTFRERLKGFERACEDYMIEADRSLVMNCEHTIQGGYEATKKLLSREDRPTALFAANYHLALGAVKALYEKNIKIPQQLSVVSFDELEFSFIMNPPISTIDQPKALIGEKAATRILQRINGDMSDFPHIDRLKTIENFTDSIGEVE